MKLARVTAAPGPLLDFVEESLSHLGAACERTWHDRLEVIAEGSPATLWRDDGALHEIELHFPDVNDAGPRDAGRQMFTGAPLLFRLVELFWRQQATEARVCLARSLTVDPPTAALVQKTWQQRSGHALNIKIGAWDRAWHFSMVMGVRCEVQAIEQNWTCHRMALGLGDGARDPALESELDFMVAPSAPAEVTWPTALPPAWTSWFERALRDDLKEELVEIRRRQERFLGKELARVDEYFTHYGAELRARMARVQKAESRQRLEDRLRAAEHEHERRRTDQVQRHEIRVVPHVDARLWVAEPAWQTEITGPHGERLGKWVFVLRTRQWRRPISHSGNNS